MPSDAVITNPALKPMMTGGSWCASERNVVMQRTIAWPSARGTVRSREYWLILRCPAAPSFESASSEGITFTSREKMIDAEMYGSTPSENTTGAWRLAPESALMRPTMLPTDLSALFARNAVRAVKSTPGRGTCHPIR